MTQSLRKYITQIILRNSREFHYADYANTFFITHHYAMGNLLMAKRCWPAFASDETSFKFWYNNCSPGTQYSKLQNAVSTNIVLRKKVGIGRSRTESYPSASIIIVSSPNHDDFQYKKKGKILVQFREKSVCSSGSLARLLLTCGPFLVRQLDSESTYQWKPHTLTSPAGPGGPPWILDRCDNFLIACDIALALHSILYAIWYAISHSEIWLAILHCYIVCNIDAINKDIT